MIPDATLSSKGHHVALKKISQHILFFFMMGLWGGRRSSSTLREGCVSLYRAMRSLPSPFMFIFLN